MESARRLNIMIAEDDQMIRSTMETYLQSFPQVNILASCSNGSELLQKVGESAPDVVFLDIEMPDMDGLAASARLKEIDQDILVVFVTGHVEYAATAFQLEAVDYLVKPISREAIHRSLNRVKKRLQASERSTSSFKITVIRNNHEMYFINTSDILYLEKQLRKTIVHTGHGEYSTSETLQSLQEKLPGHFFRCHKSFVINLNKIEKVYPIADRSYGVSFYDCAQEVTMGRKAFEQLCMLVSKNGG